MSQASDESLQRVYTAVSDAKNDIHFAPIRHHSPACAWAVKQLIQKVKPAHVLIEGPIDFSRHIDVLLDSGTLPPVAIASIIKLTTQKQTQQRRLAAYFPFCAHSPELVALQEGRRVGANLAFIDTPSMDKALLRSNDKGQEHNRPISLQDDAVFNANDYVTALAKEQGCRDGYELWDHLFETQLGTKDWRKFLSEVGAYCAGLRSMTPSTEILSQGDHDREHHMAAQIAKAQKKGGPIVVVVGGFHVPALIELLNRPALIKRPKLQKELGQSYMIRYSFKALDALNGYASGLPQPAYYDYLWQKAVEAQGQPQWRDTATGLVSAFCSQMRDDGNPINLPSQVEMLRSAESLALLRNRPGILRHDLIDGAKVSLVKGEASRRDVWSERLLTFLCGSKLGDVPASAGLPPLVEDARRRARSHRIDLSDGTQRTRKLDIRRKEPHLKASQYFHAMALLDIGFATRSTGPDYINNVRTELLFEQWSFSWSPQVEGKLVELAVYGDQLDVACIAYINDQRQGLQKEGRANDLEALCDLLGRGLLAGLGDRLTPFLRNIESDIQSSNQFPVIVKALRRLHFIQYSAGPLSAAPRSLSSKPLSSKPLEIKSCLTVAYNRLIYLCDDISNAPPEIVEDQIEALRLISELLRNEEQLRVDEDKLYDADVFNDAIDRIANANPPAEILGSVLAICTQSGRRSIAELKSALNGNFTGSVLKLEQRIGVLRGVLHTVPMLLLNEPELLKVIDDFMQEINEESFIELLPHLRLAFTALNPRETDHLSELLAKQYDSRTSDFNITTSNYTQHDLERGLLIDQRLRQTLSTDQLDDWLMPQASE